MERISRHSATLLATLALAAGASSAQDPSTPKPRVQQDVEAARHTSAAHPKFIPVDQLLSAPVVLRADAEGGSARGATESKEKELQEIEEGTTGVKTKAAASAPTGVTVVGTLRDIAIDTTTKKLTMAIIDTTEGGRAMPLTQLTWDDVGRQWTLSSREALNRAESCDGISLARLHSRIVDASDAKSTGAKVEDASGVAARDQLDPRYDLVSIFGRRELMARDGRVGAGLGVVLEVRSGALGFLRVATERGDLAVPFAALKVPTESGANRVNVDMDKAALQSAPMLGKDPKWTLDDAQFRTELYELFGVPTPAYEGASNRAGTVAQRK